MINLVRGGIILSVLAMFVVVIYAHSETEVDLSIANDSQIQLNNSVIDTNILSEDKPLEDSSVKTEEVESKREFEQGQDEQDKKKGAVSSGNKVEKTVSSRRVAGAYRGKFTATAYCLKGRTAMGHGVRKGLIAADPRVLPLGSQINIDGGGYSGTYLVSDTGGKIKGNRIDIWMASCAEARRFGRRSVGIHYLGK